VLHADKFVLVSSVRTSYKICGLDNKGSIDYDDDNYSISSSNTTSKKYKIINYYYYYC
jgi:hypothetical protein